MTSDLLEHLPSAQLEYSGRSQLLGDEPHDVDTLHWSVTATISRDTDRDTGWMDQPGASLAPPSEGGAADPITIFSMRGYTVDLYRGRSLFDALDSYSQDSAHFLSIVDDQEHNHLVAAFDDQIQSAGSGLVILDRALLAPAWRGLGGVGRLLTGRALRWLTADAKCVVAQPYPYELAERDDEPDPAVLSAGLASVRHVWSSLGFTPYTDDLYVLDPALASMENAVKLLERKLLR